MLPRGALLHTHAVKNRRYVRTRCHPILPALSDAILKRVIAKRKRSVDQEASRHLWLCSQSLWFRSGCCACMRGIRHESYGVPIRSASELANQLCLSLLFTVGPSQLQKRKIAHDKWPTDAVDGPEGCGSGSAELLSGPILG